MPTTAGNKRAVATPKLKEARRSVGALLGFYRRIRALSQKELANKAKKITGRKITASTVAMAESGLRDLNCIGIGSIPDAAVGSTG